MFIIGLVILLFLQLQCSVCCSNPVSNRQIVTARNLSVLHGFCASSFFSICIVMLSKCLHHIFGCVDVDIVISPLLMHAKGGGGGKSLDIKNFHGRLCILSFSMWKIAAEIGMFDGYIVVYKFISDLHFYVTGSDDDNESYWLQYYKDSLMQFPCSLGL
jgi:hypothetical protein